MPLLFVALYYPPNNWDSMTYHMPRVMHWIQNENVDYYFTHNDRQLYSGPLAEYVILHLYLITNSDILSNLVQYFSLIISTVSIFLITKKLKLNAGSYWLPIVLAISTPAAIMQSTSTQNDLVVASLLLSTVYYGFSKSWFLFSVSLGLGMLTKNTYAFFILPFCIYFGLNWLKIYGVKIIHWFVFFILAVVLINSVIWYRNYKYFGFPFGSKYVSNLVLNKSHSLKNVSSVLVRNIGMQLGLPSGRYNSVVDKVVFAFHDAVNVGSSIPETTHYSMPYQTQFAIHEDLSGNFALMVLIIFSSIIFIFVDRTLLPYFLCMSGGLFLYTFTFKWQPWGTRLLLPWFMISIPFVSVVVEKIFEKYKKIGVLLVLLLVVSALPFVAGSGRYFGGLHTTTDSNRQVVPLPLFGREGRQSRYFFARQPLLTEMEGISKVVKNGDYSDVYLDLKYDSWEYPWWIFFNKDSGIRVSIYNGSVLNNKSVIISDKSSCVSLSEKYKNTMSFESYCLVKSQ